MAAIATAINENAKLRIGIYSAEVLGSDGSGSEALPPREPSPLLEHSRTGNSKPFRCEFVRNPAQCSVLLELHAQRCNRFTLAFGEELSSRSTSSLVA